MSNFVYNNLPLPGTKATANPAPAGIPYNETETASDFNTVTQAIYDLRTALNANTAVSILNFAANPSGISDTGPAIAAAVAALPSGGTINFPAGTYLVATNVTVPAGIALVFNTGASLTFNATAQLTLNGAISAPPLSQIFSWNSSNATPVIWSSAGILRSTPTVAWFGATGNGTTDDTAAIQMALTVLANSTNAAANGGGARLKFPLGTYTISNTLSLTASFVTLEGAGWGTIIQWGGTTSGISMILFLNCYGCKILNMAICGNPAHPPYACVESRVDTNSPSAFGGSTRNWFEDLFIGGNSAGEATYGIAYTKASGSNDQDNDQGYLKRVTCLNLITAGFYVGHAQSKGHMLLDCAISAPVANNMAYCVYLANGSFMAYGGYYTGATTSAFYLGSPDDAILLSAVGSESSNRFLTTGGPSSNGWPISMHTCRIACDELNTDGQLITIQNCGPFSMIGCTTDSLNGSNTLAQMSWNSGAAGQIVLIGNYFGQTNAASQSFVGSLNPATTGVFQAGNQYANSSGAITTGTGGEFSAPTLCGGRVAYGTTSLIQANSRIAGATAGSITLTLPAAMGAGQEMIVKDESGTAGSANITVAPPAGGGTIDGSGSSKTISSNYGVLRFYAVSALAWMTM